MIADPEGPSFITRTVGHRRYADGASVTHDPHQTKFQDKESSAQSLIKASSTGEIWSRPASHLADQRLYSKLARGVIIGAVDRSETTFAGPRLRVPQRYPSFSLQTHPAN
jgi:hypothetical protein